MEQPLEGCVSPCEKIVITSDAEKVENESLPIFDTMMMRGEFLRQLRSLADQDDQERTLTSHCNTESIISLRNNEHKSESLDNLGDSKDDFNEILDDDDVVTLPCGNTVLDYNSYLAHQRYYDDYKHVGYTFIDYGAIKYLGKQTSNNLEENQSLDDGRLIISQDCTLGKGGFCWDAAFVLGEYLISVKDHWSSSSKTSQKSSDSIASIPKVLDLGSGTGLTGIMIAKACNCHVTITDLPELINLMQTNIRLNFYPSDVIDSFEDANVHGQNVDNSALKNVGLENMKTHLNEIYPNHRKSLGKISSRVLTWGDESQYPDDTFDVIMGADIVTSIYDPVSLAKTIHHLSSTSTKIYISGKSRLDLPHKVFETELRKLFRNVVKTKLSSRSRNPDIFIICAESKI
mmetsp:Transcript_19289/g.27138  ORF Transcript_19289/g.27138 Transcript_19289/m.27138 type:complete len:403 (+) Transcript_19289:229-1437(+)|eukprot:CAMPEP_0184866754 /NCGR_PEP_ID=MMETSP0580-20130426/23579_1 /TAXON_ID=1118495 /ORGANISM="Dactyliosolen fragilissimus" /LENGTH=402 /DNA_ID=CAMNT_0027366603 /DNA_START=174 /DNA_END=1382 /DNA_ORIENTATION=-